MKQLRKGGSGGMMGRVVGYGLNAVLMFGPKTSCIALRMREECSAR